MHFPRSSRSLVYQERELRLGSADVIAAYSPWRGFLGHSGKLIPPLGYSQCGMLGQHSTYGVELNDLQKSEKLFLCSLWAYLVVLY